jgi:hypothetical protein
MELSYESCHVTKYKQDEVSITRYIINCPYQLRASHASIRPQWLVDLTGCLAGIMPPLPTFHPYHDLPT